MCTISDNELSQALLVFKSTNAHDVHCDRYKYAQRSAYSSARPAAVGARLHEIALVQNYRIAQEA